jgi:hypothetical protein
MSNNKYKCEICPICLDTIRNINSKRVIKQKCCNKPFHKKCINKWYKVKKICPLCRTKKKSLFDNEETKFLSDSLLSIVPILRPLYRSYGGDETMNEISSFLSICEDTVYNIGTENVEITETDNLSDLSDLSNLTNLSETLITAKNLVRSIRTIMNNTNESQII